MKKNVLVFAFLCALLFSFVEPCCVLANDVVAGYAEVLEDNTAVYEEAHSSSQIQHYLTMGTEVYVVYETENGFYYINYYINDNPYTGYVAVEKVEYDIDSGFAEEITPELDSLTEFADNVNAMISMISVVPLIIGAVFSFLPAWCLTLAGVCFGMLLIVLAWKAFRG